MRTLEHYLDLFGQTDVVGPELYARAIYAARHGDADKATPDDLRPLVRDLSDTSSDDARQRLLVEAALYALGDPDEGRYELQHRLGDEVGVAARTVRSWLSGERSLEGPARKLVERIALG